MMSLIVLDGYYPAPNFYGGYPRGGGGRFGGSPGMYYGRGGGGNSWRDRGDSRPSPRNDRGGKNDISMAPAKV